MTKKLVLFGIKSYSEVLYEYFQKDSEFEVVAFTAEEEFLERKVHLGQPVIDFNVLESRYPPSEFYFHAAIVYSRLNRTRERICQAAKQKGYRLASYISSRAFIWPNVELGDHVVVMENNTLQPFVRIGNNVILWSGNHIGHHSTIEDNAFISSHVVLSGHSRVGENCFLGVNSTLADGCTLGDYSWVYPAATITANIPSHSLVNGPGSNYRKLKEEALFKVLGKKSR